MVPIITDVSVGGQFRNGTWAMDMADGTWTRFQFRASFLVPTRDDYLDAH